MSKPKICPILNIFRTDKTLKCLQGECVLWDEELEDCLFRAALLVLAYPTHVIRSKGRKDADSKK